MLNHNAIAIVPVRSLEAGDVIAKEFLGGVVSGKIAGVAHTRHDLTPEHLTYMQEHGLTIPEEKWGLLDSPRTCVIFGEFSDSQTMRTGKFGHMYVDLNTPVAVFPSANAH